MPQIYNPRDNSPIKMPEKKLCPTCGQEITPEVKPITNEMNSYVNPLTGVAWVINSSEESLEIKGVKMYKVTGYDKSGKPVSSFAPAPAKPATTPVTAIGATKAA